MGPPRPASAAPRRRLTWSCRRRLRQMSQRRPLPIPCFSSQMALRRRKAGTVSQRMSSSIKLRPGEEGLVRPLRAHILRNWRRRSSFGAGGPPAVAVVVRIEAAAQDARSVRRCDGCRCAACRPVPSMHLRRPVSGVPHGVIDAGRHHRDADNALQLSSKMAPTRMLASCWPLHDAGGSFVDLKQGHILAAGDGDQQAAGALDRGVLNQAYRKSRPQRRRARASRRKPRPRPSSPRLFSRITVRTSAKSRLIGFLDDQVGDAGHACIKNLIGRSRKHQQ